MHISTPNGQEKQDIPRLTPKKNSAYIVQVSWTPDDNEL